MNAHVDRQQLTRELVEMKDKGRRGAIIWDMGARIDPDGIIPTGPPFLGPESVASIHHVIDQAERLGLGMGFPQCDEQVRAIANRMWGDCNGKDIRSHTYGKGKVLWSLPIIDVLNHRHRPRLHRHWH